MIVPFILLASLVVLIPAFGILDDVWTIGVVSAVLAATLMIIAIAMPTGQFARFMRLLRPVLVLALGAPALWMLLQVVPMPARALANPIWASASAALNQRFVGAITVDIGATLLSLVQYCAVVAVALVTAAVTLDRERARLVLYALVVVTTLVVVRQFALDITSFDRSHADGSSDWTYASTVAVVGVLLSCAATIQAAERLQRSGRPRRSKTSRISLFSAAILSLIICAAAVFTSTRPVIIIATLLGTGTLLAVYAVRRWLIGLWSGAGLALATAIGLVGAFGAIPVNKNVDLTIALSTQDQIVTEHMLVDAAPTGSGAGTFNALLPIYRDIGAASHEDPTAAAAIAIEMGPAFLWGAVIMALFGAWTLFNRSLSRGHDYIYSAAGAGALVSLPIMALADRGILNFGASLLVAVLCGLAFAQSLSGAARDVMSLELQDRSDQPDGQERRTRPSPLPTFDRTWPRVALAVFGLLLTEQAAWILSAERYSHEQNAGPTDTLHDEIGKGASVAVVRGDLWAASGFSLLARQPWVDLNARQPHDSIPEPALNAFTRALHYSPHRGDVWLTLAALASQYRLAGYDAGALLKMSYYTAPNELALLPLRLRIALAGGDQALGEPELREMIKGDISRVISRQPVLRPALVTAYRSASPNGKALVENLISQLDPDYLKTIRAQYP